MLVALADDVTAAAIVVIIVPNARVLRRVLIADDEGANVG